MVFRIGRHSVRGAEVLCLAKLSKGEAAILFPVTRSHHAPVPGKVSEAVSDHKPLDRIADRVAYIGNGRRRRVEIETEHKRVADAVPINTDCQVERIVAFVRANRRTTGIAAGVRKLANDLDRIRTVQPLAAATRNAPMRLVRHAVRSDRASAVMARDLMGHRSTVDSVHLEIPRSRTARRKQNTKITLRRKTRDLNDRLRPTNRRRSNSHKESQIGSARLNVMPVGTQIAIARLARYLGVCVVLILLTNIGLAQRPKGRGGRSSDRRQFGGGGDSSRFRFSGGGDRQRGSAPMNDGPSRQPFDRQPLDRQPLGSSTGAFRGSSRFDEAASKFRPLGPGTTQQLPGGRGGPTKRSAVPFNSPVIGRNANSQSRAPLRAPFAGNARASNTNPFRQRDGSLLQSSDTVNAGSTRTVAQQPRTRVTLALPAEYDQLDTNHDGQIGLYEWPRNDFVTFFRIDRNNDGFLTPKELTKAASTLASSSENAPR